MSDATNALTLEQVRDRLKATGLRIEEERLDMVRVLLDTALAPVRAMDTRALRVLEPAVVFDAEADRGRR